MSYSQVMYHRRDDIMHLKFVSSERFSYFPISERQNCFQKHSSLQVDRLRFGSRRSAEWTPRHACLPL